MNFEIKNLKDKIELSKRELPVCLYNGGIEENNRTVPNLKDNQILQTRKSEYRFSYRIEFPVHKLNKICWKDE